MFELCPTTERQVQRQLQVFLNLRYRHLNFRKEQVQFPYSTKSYKPDFVSTSAGIAVDVKLCNSENRVNKLVDEINADITGYRSHYRYLFFVVYDTNRNILDPLAFTQDFERYNPGVRVVVIP
jgi:hypothetical protein